MKPQPQLYLAFFLVSIFACATCWANPSRFGDDISSKRAGALIQNCKVQEETPPAPAVSVKSHLFIRIDRKGYQGYLDYLVPAASPALADLSSLEGKTAQISLGRKLAGNSVGARLSEANNVVRFPLVGFWPEPFKGHDNPVDINVVLTDKIPQVDLTFDLVLGPDVSLNYVMPAQATTRSSEKIRTGQERLFLQLNGFRESLLIIDLDDARPSWISDTLLTAWKSALPVFTAIVILVFTTFLQRYFAIKGVQLNELDKIRLKLRRIEADPASLNPKNDLIQSIKQLQDKPEYSGFHPKFSGPLEEILDTGIVDDVQRYRTAVSRLKTRVRLKWIVFR